MERYAWSRLSHLQVGKLAEYVAKMEFTQYGFQVFTPEVDDRGIDYIARFEDGPWYEVQVKAVRGLNYVFMQKDKFPLKPERLLVVAILTEGGPPDLYVIPSMAWKAPNELFVSRDYEGLKSKPEWGLNLTKRNMALLAPFALDRVVTQIVRHGGDLGVGLESTGGTA